MITILEVFGMVLTAFVCIMVIAAILGTLFILMLKLFDRIG